ncbi:histidine kinase [Geobacter pickeringii]|uniref:histidine kinase n=2 Tax=Geobacter pickeringii TaxID=345632 RepID=A0A0B5BF89_9BACT|nr:histidine kinase [Geobacter pickeringii]
MILPPLRALIIDDSPLDAELVMRELRKGFTLTVARIDSPESLADALATGEWDIAISDYVMPRFSGLDAIAMLREKQYDIPIMVCSGKVGEDAAVETMRAGANDYILKDNLARLLPAIRRELSEARMRREREADERRSRELSEAMAAASLRFLETGSICRMAQVLVDRCVTLTTSSFGFLYDLRPNGDARILAVSATSSLAAGNCRCFTELDGPIENETGHVVARNDCLLFAPVIDEQTILCNDFDAGTHRLCLQEHSRRRISSFLGTPLKVGGKVVGVIGLANKPGGFTERERRELETFAQTAALALHSARAELEHKQAMEQLRQAQKMEAVGQLAGGIAHDFNNLLTVINGYSTLLLHEMPSDDPYRPEVEHILQAGERAADLTHQLLAFSRRQILEPKVININHLVKNIEKMLKRLIRENVILNTRLADEIGMVKADPGQVEQIIMNLVVNARDAMENGGIVTIETGEAVFDDLFVAENRGALAGNYVMLAVHDNGIGMSEEIKRKIFEPFFTTKAQGRGTGLGLATVYGIVKQSGGYIQVLSESGKGSSFRVFLPREEAAADAAGARSRHEGPRGSETILVVEDEVGVLNLAARTLRSRGYNVLQAGSPESAVEIFRQNRDRIDLVLSDVVMPDKSGPKLAAEFREQSPGLKVMFMSGYTEESIVPQEIAHDRTAFILKPFSPDDLAGRVRELLGSRAG